MRGPHRALYTLLQTPPLNRCRKESHTLTDKWGIYWITGGKKLLNFSVVFFLIGFCANVPTTRCSGSVCARRDGGCLLPHVDSGHCKLHSFQPQNHEEPLAERAVAHVLAIVSSLKNARKVSLLKEKEKLQISPLLINKRGRGVSGILKAVSSMKGNCRHCVVAKKQQKNPNRC